MNAHIDRLGPRLSRLLSAVPSPPPADVHPKIGQRLSDARAAFAQGFRQALSVAPAMLPQILQDEPCQRRGFALEGAAMALVLMDEFSAAPRRLLGALLRGRSAGEHILGAIGVGWASAHLGRSADWLPPGLHPRYRSCRCGRVWLSPRILSRASVRGPRVSHRQGRIEHPL